MRIITPEQMRSLDSRTIEELGLPGATLMETAGRGVVAAIEMRIGGVGDGRLATILCGVGNNGGDGFVIARELHYRRFAVHVYTVGDRGNMSDDAKLHYKAMQAAGVRDRHHTKPPDKRELGGLRRSLARSAVIVDALIGTGPTTDLRDPIATFAAQVDGRHSGLVVSVDVPSGINAANGRKLGVAVKADLVCTMAAAKTGLFFGAGPGHYNELEVVPIGVPPAWADELKKQGRAVTWASEKGELPGRNENAHKGRFGHLLVLAGSPGKTGAALLSTTAAMRSGVGLCTLATSGEIRARLEGAVADLMVEAVRGGASEKKRVEKLIDGKAAIAAGPGMGTASASIELVKQVLEMSKCPVVLDADAITCLATKPEIAEPAQHRLVLTPHPGEMARLLESEVAAVQADRLGSARKAAARFKAVVVLKGARTVIAAPGGQWAICNEPNAALAKAGSGDVLCGIIGALLAQGLRPGAAARVGVTAHNAAGKIVAQDVGPVASMASDLVGVLADVWRADG